MNEHHTTKSNQASNSALNTAIPTHYIGLGASNGGVEAIEHFFSAMPPTNNLAFIVIQHLVSSEKDISETLSKTTTMPLYWAEHGISVEANHVYLIPPKKHLIIFQGKLLLKAKAPDEPTHLPIDLFFRSLAEDQTERAIGIIFSGTGADGIRGIRSIKEHNGMIMAQSEDSAAANGMPNAAISTGLVDYVLSPDEMPSTLLSYINHPLIRTHTRTEQLANDKENMNRIFAELRQCTKVDFTFYKPSTIIRRIERRMTVCQTRDFNEYVRHLTNTPGEVLTLYRELLINVTNFFRDPEVMDVLQQEMRRIFDRSDNHEIRLWVAGCATGEEAYTLAILAREALDRLGKHRDVRIFATDIDKDALIFAGNGLYPESIAADLSKEFLDKYFNKIGNNFQIDPRIRAMIVFAQHNLIKDPPFARIDVVSCRNLLIYLQPILQQKALQMINFSLNAKGLLLLGNSETVGELVDHFYPLHSKYKIYETTGKKLPSNHPAMLDSHDEMHRYSSYPALEIHRPSHPANQEKTLLAHHLLETVSELFGGVFMVVNEQMDVLCTTSNISTLYNIPYEKPGSNIFNIAVPSLFIPLSTGIQKVFRTRRPVKYHQIKTEETPQRILNLEIRLLHEKQELAAVFIDFINRQESTKETSVDHAFDTGTEAQQRIKEMEMELQFTKESLHAAIEKLETSNEELLAANEELLASNEELQSTNEELQCSNEELFSVNSDYQNKINELTELNNDVDNLLSDTHTTHLFLDEDLLVRRFSPTLSNIFHITEFDIGRSLAHLVNRFVDFNPIPFIESVQKNYRPIEKDVITEDGQRYLMRLTPYRIAPGTFSGVLLSFVDNSEI